MAGHVLPGRDDNIVLTFAIVPKMRLERLRCEDVLTIRASLLDLENSIGGISCPANVFSARRARLRLNGRSRNQGGERSRAQETKEHRCVKTQGRTSCRSAFKSRVQP